MVPGFPSKFVTFFILNSHYRLQGYHCGSHGSSVNFLCVFIDFIVEFFVLIIRKLEQWQGNTRDRTNSVWVYHPTQRTHIQLKNRFWSEGYDQYFFLIKKRIRKRKNQREGLGVSQGPEGISIDSGMDLSIRFDKFRVFINKTLSTQSLINQLLIKRVDLSISVGSR